MAHAPLVLLALSVHLLSGSLTPDPLVWQTPEVTVKRGDSAKLNCTFSETLRHLKPFLTWVKRKQNGREAIIYPNNMSVGQVQVYVDSEVFKSQGDAGILLMGLRVRDAGVYVCSITLMENGVSTEYRGQGTRLTIADRVYDKLIACCPLGVIIAALLVLHYMVYRKWREYKGLQNERVRKEDSKG